MKSLSPNLIVQNVNASVEFYQSVLGFSLVQTVPESGKYDWAMLQKENVTIMFQSIESMNKDLPEFDCHSIGGSFTLFIILDEVELFYNSVKKDAEIFVELHKTFYGMNEFTIKDPNGYLLTFAEPVA